MNEGWGLSMTAIRWSRTECRPANPRRGLHRPIAILAFWAAASTACVSVRACDTPVYRYAMYRWTPMAYDAFYFHRGPISKADRELHQSLFGSTKGGVAANWLLTDVDLDRKNALDVLPDPVKKRWQSESAKPLPRYLIFSPWGAEVFCGPADSATARQLVESPTRAEIGKAFDQGYGIVLLILGGDRLEANARMESVARSVIAKAAAGDLFPEPAAGPESGKAASPLIDPASADSPADRQNDPRRSPLRVALVKLDRTSNSEPWLLKMLAAMTSRTQETTDDKAPREPMLYPIYGRGRVMPPGIGKDVTTESLTELLRFLADGCSCTIKDQNPGLDLLMQWDWEATAEKLLASDPSMAPPPPYAEVAADGSPAAIQAEVKPASAPIALPTNDAAKRPATPSPLPAGKLLPEPAPSQGVVVSSPASPQDPSMDPDSNRSISEAGIDVEEVAQTGFAVRQRWQFGIGLAGVAAVVIAIGLALVRRQQP